MKIKRLFPASPASRFNVAVWQKAEKDHLVVVGRSVGEPGRTGKPDVGKLFLSELDSNYNVIFERILWEPINKNFYLEDPRAIVLENGTVVLGLTAVVKKPGVYVPYPAIVHLTSFDTRKDLMPPVNIIEVFGPGKNITPVSEFEYIFRPEKKDHLHKLLLFSVRNPMPEKIQTIHFPENLNWGKWKIGTTIPPIWMNKQEALLIIHGISIVKGKYIYSIGRAKLYIHDNGNFKVKVHRKPLITPDTFVDSVGKYLVRELHPKKRRVVYATGGIIKRNEPNTLYLYVNVGDRITFEVGITKEELMEGLF